MRRLIAVVAIVGLISIPALREARGIPAVGASAGYYLAGGDGFAEATLSGGAGWAGAEIGAEYGGMFGGLIGAGAGALIGFA